MSGVCSGLDPFTGEVIEVRFGATITNVDPVLGAPESDGTFLSPGFIDLQVNGFAGVDFNNPALSSEEIQTAIDTLFATGVTRFYPTVITADSSSITSCLRNLSQARTSLPHGSAMAGFHLEGPHISPEEGPRGAHPAAHVRPPSLEEFRLFQDAAQGGIRLITLSPEWPDAPAFIEAVVRENVGVSIGHTNANSDQIRAAVESGATMSTHLGNATHRSLPKFPNYLLDQLADQRLAASFIIDGIHVPASFLQVALRAKGIVNSILVTDAAMPAACLPGVYRLGQQQVELLPDGRVVMSGTTRLAGSSLTMDRAVANVVRMANLTLPEALSMATRNPARVARLPHRQKGISPGQQADLVRFAHLPSGEVHVLETYLNGQKVYSRK